MYSIYCWLFLKELNLHPEDKLPVIPPVHHHKNDVSEICTNVCISSVTLYSETIFSLLCNLSVNWITSPKSLCVFAHR